MNKLFAAIFLVTTVIISCTPSAPVSKKDPLESARGFIEASLQGNFDQAQQYLLNDSTNMLYFDTFKDFYAKRSDAEKDGYKNASIIIDSTQNLSDSVAIITYANTYKNKPSKLKLVKKGSDWLVDFKYTLNSDQ
ncbi:MAG TPA: hypothetical protein VG847_03720 [Chitinophagaceae bacterium]|nr:hypothetical protein [Chitinophagaceae bacterium]